MLERASNNVEVGSEKQSHSHSLTTQSDGLPVQTPGGDTDRKLILGT